MSTPKAPSNTVDIFQQYPPVRAQISGYHTDEDLIKYPPKEMGYLESLLVTGDYVPLSQSATRTEQRDNLDAEYGRRILRVTRGVYAAVAGTVIAANAEILDEEIENPATYIGFGLLLGGILRAMRTGDKDPRIDNITAKKNLYGSKIRRPDSWLSLAIGGKTGYK